MPELLFTDTSGLIPASWGQTVARIADNGKKGPQSGPLRPSIQANAALRGTLGRAPAAGRRNLVNSSEGPITAYPSRGGAVSTAAETIPGFTQSIAFGVPSGATAFAYQGSAAQGVTYTLSIYVEMDDGGAPTVGTGAGNALNIVIGGVTASATVTQVAGPLYRVSGVATAGASAASTGLAKTVLNDTRTFRASGMQLELGSSLTAYQRTAANGFDVTEEGLPSPAYLRLDLVDDIIPTNFSDGLSGDLLVIGRSGSWIERDVTLTAAGWLNVGPTTIAGRVPGILRAVGDIVAIVPIDRTMTQTELDRMIAYYRPLGGKGLLTPGAELVTLASMVGGSGLWSFASSTWTKTAGDAAALGQAVSPVAGTNYLVSVTGTRSAGTLTPRLTGGTTVSGPAISATGVSTCVLRAATGNAAFEMLPSSDFAGTVTAVSVRPLTAS